MLESAEHLYDLLCCSFFRNASVPCGARKPLLKIHTDKYFVSVRVCSIDVLQVNLLGRLLRRQGCLWRCSLWLLNCHGYRNISNHGNILFNRGLSCYIRFLACLRGAQNEARDSSYDEWPYYHELRCHSPERSP